MSYRVPHTKFPCVRSSVFHLACSRRSVTVSWSSPPPSPYFFSLAVFRASQLTEHLEQAIFHYVYPSTGNLTIYKFANSFHFAILSPISQKFLISYTDLISNSAFYQIGIFNFPFPFRESPWIQHFLGVPLVQVPTIFTFNFHFIWCNLQSFQHFTKCHLPSNFNLLSQSTHRMIERNWWQPIAIH